LNIIGCIVYCLLIAFCIFAEVLFHRKRKSMLMQANKLIDDINRDYDFNNLAHRIVQTSLIKNKNDLDKYNLVLFQQKYKDFCKERVWIIKK